MQKIIYITSEIPYPLTSGLLRHYHFLHALGQKYDITYLSLTKKPAVPEEALRELKKFVREIFVFGAADAESFAPVRLAGKLPVGRARVQKALRYRLAARQMQEKVDELLQTGAYDLIFFSGKDTYPAIANVQDFPLVIDCCDATSLRVRRQLRYVPAARLPWLLMRYFEVKRIERRLVQKTPHLAFASRRDRQAMLGKRILGAVIPQAVDLEVWRRNSTMERPNTLVFTGVMSYAPNHDAAMLLVQKILPRVREQIPEASVWIVGRDPLPELQRAARKHRNVRVTGFVDDIRPYLERGSLFVAPIRYASGVQNKVLEAMALNVPVLTTPVVADGLRITDGQLPVRVAETPEDMAREIIEMLQDELARQRLAEEGREFVEQHFTWPRNIEKLEGLFRAAQAASHRPGSSELKTEAG